uniref:NADH dehydrogenase subunit 1 n=1 Tax=Parachordodes pustulosus TaxID=3049253 RepID=UPI002E79DBDC|nr:NADH dehydrogenase subunit 1 [Parachordodes pustulosus]WQH58900.1 NADH dehydrogenase subunit 1 [Parachordodes pustulosus]
MVLFEFVLTQASLLVSMSFFTLLERKMLGSVQIRKGPNKVPVLGLVQPFMDAVKLLSKGSFEYSAILLHLWTVVPVLGLVLYLVLFEFVLTQASFALTMSFSLFFVMVFLGLGVYLLVLMGWLSNSKYSFLGATRAVSQAVSYELLLSVILLVMAATQTSVLSHLMGVKLLLTGFVMMGFMFFYIVSMMAESNRSPFDLMEGESELVSGFNTEYFSGVFAIIFMAEYVGMMFFSYLLYLLFLFLDIFYSIMVVVPSVVSLLYLVTRASLPRMRYDTLLKLCWENYLIFLFLILNFYLFFLG